MSIDAIVALLGYGLLLSNMATVPAANLTTTEFWENLLANAYKRALRTV